MVLVASSVVAALVGGVLAFVGDGGDRSAPVPLDTPAPPTTGALTSDDLVGKWTVVSRNGEALSIAHEDGGSVTPRPQPSFTLDKDGSYAAFDGCNRYSGRWSLSGDPVSGDRQLEVSADRSTTVECDGDDTQHVSLGATADVLYTDGSLAIRWADGSGYEAIRFDELSPRAGGIADTAWSGRIGDREMLVEFAEPWTRGMTNPHIPAPIPGCRLETVSIDATHVTLSASDKSLPDDCPIAALVAPEGDQVTYAIRSYRHGVLLSRDDDVLVFLYVGG